MNIQYTDLQFNQAKAIDLLPLRCEQCNTTFYVMKKRIKGVLNGTVKSPHLFCSTSCSSKWRCANLHHPTKGKANQMVNGIKKCPRCKQQLPVCEFSKQSRSIDGYSPYCKTCYKEYRQKYDKKPQYKLRQTEYARNRRATDPLYNIRHNLARRINALLHGKTKSQSTLDLLGCTLLELKVHLESKFTTDMSWDNYGMHGWHVDHIVPCYAFDLNDPVEQKQCCHFSNLQPLWAKDNISKSDKWLV